MRIETKARRDNSTFESFAQGGAGVPNAAPLVWLFGNRQPLEEFLGQICLPISLLNFEPFYSAMRPNGLRDDNQQKLSSRCETKRAQNALYKAACDELFTDFISRGSETQTAFLTSGR